MELHNLADEVIGLRFGALTPQFSLMKRLRQMLEATLPENAAELAKGRLHVSVTRISDKTNHLISTFEDRSVLIEVRHGSQIK